jgi:signal transduction histidine kinase
MSRIQKMANACQTIMNGDLSHRIPLSQSGPIDDYDKISVNVNLMLDRIQKLMTQVQQVSDNIAHDLRSPLTHVQTRLEQFLNTHDSKEIESTLSDIDRILDMFNALLSIAKLEAKQLHQPEEIEINRILMDACDMYRPMFENKGIKLQFNIGDGRLKADQNLLFQAFLNLLDNALKFTPEHGVVIVDAYAIKDRFEINITDSGPGIDEGKFEQVFERFSRLDNARTLPGFGLGLSQVKAIVQFHRGSVTLDNNDGLSVRISLPIRT